MTRWSRFGIVLIATTGTAASPAVAGGWSYTGPQGRTATFNHWGGPNNWGHPGCCHGGVAAGAVAGLAVGTAVGVAAASRPVYGAPPVVYAPPPVVYTPPPVLYAPPGGYYYIP